MTPVPTNISHENNGVKLTNTVYRILDFLPDSDPLKNRAKEKTLAILENLTIFFSVNNRSVKERVSLQLLEDIAILENYLEIGKHQGWISAVNFFIIIKEYKLIEVSLQKFQQIDDPLLQSEKITNPGHNTAPGSARYRTVPGSAKPQTSNPDKSMIIDHNWENTRILDSNKIKENVSHAVIDKYSPRQEKILKILTEREKAQVSDLVKELPKVTKRTIRRDLDDLLRKGRIVRVGEWNQIFYQKSGLIDRTSILDVKMS